MKRLKKIIYFMLPLLMIYITVFPSIVYAASGEVSESSVYCKGQLSLDDNLVYRISYTANDRWGTTEKIDCSTPVQNVNVCLYVEQLGTNFYTLRVLNGDWIPGQILHYSGLFGGIDPYTSTNEHFLNVTPYPYSDYSEYACYSCSFETNIPIFESEAAARSWIAGVNGIETAINYNKTYTFDSGASSWNSVAVSGDSHGSFIFNALNEQLQNSSESSDANDAIQNEQLTDEVIAPNSMLDIFKNFSVIFESIARFVKSLYFWVIDFINTFFNDFVPNVLERNFNIIVDAIGDLVDSFLEMLQGLWDWIYTHEFIDGYSLQSIFEFYRNIFVEIREAIEGIVSGEVTFPELMGIILPDRLESIINSIYNSGINSSGEFALDTLFKFWLVPDPDMINSCFEQNSTENLSVHKVIGFTEGFFADLKSLAPAAPMFTVPAGKYGFIVLESDYVISFSWFDKFKPYTDPLIAAFLYIGILWRLFCNIPGLFSGASAAASSSLSLHDRIIRDSHRNGG